MRVQWFLMVVVWCGCAGGSGVASGGDVPPDAEEGADLAGGVDPAGDDDAPADAPPDTGPRTTPGGLPLGLPFVFEREGAGPGEGVAEFTRKYTGFLKKVDYFRWAAETSAGMDASTGVPDYLIWWHDFVAVKQGDTVTFKASKADGGSHNNAVPTCTVLAGALAGYLASADPAMGYIARQYTRSLIACQRGFVFDDKDPVDWLIARNIVGRNHEVMLAGGRLKVVDYSEWYFPYEGWNADRFRYERNPTYGDIWVTNKRSKDDLPYIFTVAAWLPYVIELTTDEGLREDARQALDLLRKAARDIVDSGWKIRTKDRDGKVFIPEDQDLASFVAYTGIFPDAECDARLASALLGYGEPHGVDCGSGQGSLYDDFAAAGHYFNYDIIVHFHIVSTLLALTHGHAGVAEALVRGLATRLERYRTAGSAEPGAKEPDWERDISMWLLRAATVGLPLTADEARLVQKFHSQAVDEYASFPNFDLWSPDVPDGTYSFRDGFHPTHRPTAIQVEDMASILEYCGSPFRNPAGTPFVDCDVLMDPARWGE